MEGFGVIEDWGEEKELTPARIERTTLWMCSFAGITRSTTELRGHAWGFCPLGPGSVWVLGEGFSEWIVGALAWVLVRISELGAQVLSYMTGDQGRGLQESLVICGS